MEIQQSSLYASYITSLGWHVESVDGSQLFIKQFPLYGGFAKLQRVTRLPTIHDLLPLLSKYRVRKLSVEPDSAIPQKKFSRWLTELSPHISLVTTPYIPTKTIRVDLEGPEKEIFMRFSEAKRRAVRRAVKNQITILPSDHIEDLIHIKNRSAGFLGFITTTGINKLWPIFAPEHAAVLLAYSPNMSSRPPSRDPSSNRFLNWIPGHLPARLRQAMRAGARNDNHVVGGILLLFWDTIAYYWIAGATREGKKLFAPTLLVWEAIKLAKKREAKQFDFVGVWDERLPAENHNWKGFTKFKEGFGGTELYYPIFRSK
ncbi:MAG: peptidoglycan bridge formation glycyltransferase FemA/FemB family protein [Candidatus Gottesmanbacteria bacterium]|nr:peptidoglycan bridge formation glycyltransferase FemA/FemB family protein [Candidatus Gottesmanbacteria bacterium]